MAGSSSALTAAEIAAAAQAYKPLLAASNAIANPVYAPDYVQARWSANGTWTDADITHASYPGRRAYDGWLGVPTRATVAAGNTICIVFELDYTKEWDLIMLGSHNFGDVGVDGVVVNVSVADDDIFTSGLDFEVYTWGSGAGGVVLNRRLIALSLGAAGNMRYTGYPYARIQIASVTGDFTEIPYIGEVFFGRRRQMDSRPILGFSPQQMESEIGVFESKSGNGSTYARAKGRRVVNADFRLDSTAIATTVRTLFEEADYGAKPVLWIEDASVAVTVHTPEPAWMRAPPGLALPVAGPVEQLWHLDMLEVSPFLSGEE